MKQVWNSGPFSLAQVSVTSIRLSERTFAFMQPHRRLTFLTFLNSTIISSVTYLKTYYSVTTITTKYYLYITTKYCMYIECTSKPANGYLEEHSFVFVQKEQDIANPLVYKQAMGVFLFLQVIYISANLQLNLWLVWSKLAADWQQNLMSCKNFVTISKMSVT